MVWENYIDVVLRDIANGAITKEDAARRLWAVVEAAAEKGSAGAVQAIISRTELTEIRIDLAADDNFIIQRAAANGSVEIVEFLLEKKEGDVNKYGYQKINPAAGNNKAIIVTSGRGHVNMVA